MTQLDETDELWAMAFFKPLRTWFRGPFTLKPRHVLVVRGHKMSQKLQGGPQEVIKSAVTMGQAETKGSCSQHLSAVVESSRAMLI